MIEYKILNPSFFIECMISISKLVTDTVLQFGGQLRSYGLDPSRICLYEFVIGGSELEIISDKEEIIMICLSDLVKILERFKNPDNLTLFHEDNQIKLQGVVNGKKKTFRISVLYEKIPADITIKTVLNSMFNIHSGDFMDMVKDTELYSEFFTMKTINNKLVIFADSVIGDMSTEFGLDMITSEEQCSYSTAYMKNILKTMNNQDITVGFSKDGPVMVYNKISLKSFIRWHLAPRVDVDDLEDDDEDDDD